ncbi:MULTISPECIES: GlsB/YeaQ/YmgE family stress response membrane protein [unclassified Pseudoclavibacter]|uniref:GlsB/YeaQ/YmgE family stress response membrane protein n=1 Tax=unclassified Pseudoclavibacter TaxID=2615177 RepID=UPI0012EF9F6D|nr:MULTISPECIES: GlsB/YeaQ/YmgE family stress response membrane protein [unclassified Pseudoclavibacter]MBF4457669.1 GlsB/YeaQ/YmgE family stress response membrane protein [Pseudoclavibacter sp. VKM Ac-2867]VXB05015.1 GlsB/YeaQ/YmgE family stress response membrane protein [Pseudoclavibacter sp. 8L]
MSYFAFLAIGLLLGVLAKRFLPTRRRDDWIAPLFVGALGALFGGWLSSVLFWSSTSDPFSLPNWTSAIVGAVASLAVYLVIVRITAPRND